MAQLLPPPANNHKYCLTTAILLALLGATAMSCDDDNSSNACISRCVDESTAIKCENGSEKTVPCESNEVCSDGQCMALTSDTCSTPGPECVTGDSFRSCVDGYWSSVAKCSDGKVCSKGHCVDAGDSCRINARKCSADNTGYMICTDDDGIERWSGVIPCDNGTVCDGGECVSEADKCTATEPECTADNKGYRVCVQGVWSNVIPCTGTATCQNGQCTGEDVTSKLPCTEVDKMECLSNTRIKVCGRDKYWSFMDCPSDVPLCDRSKNECVAAACNESDVQCRDEKTLATCVEHAWKYTECPDDKPLCKNNTCQEIPTECKANVDKLCLDDTHVKVCNKNGNWEEIRCNDGMVCNDGECSECKNGDKECKIDYHTLRTCKNGKWTESECKTSQPYCAYGTDTCKKVSMGDITDSSYSFCLDSQTLVFGGWTDMDSGKARKVVYTTFDCPGSCIEAKDGIGATCASSDGIWAEQPGWECKSYNVGAKKTAIVWDRITKGYSAFMHFYDKYDTLTWYLDSYTIDGESYKTYLTAKCAVCKEMNESGEDRYRYVPVDESFCKSE